ncbi:MAG: TIGR00153 family protein [Planctomycetota bacterium]
MSIYNRFETHPFEPLNEHMTKVKECVALVSPMFACMLSGDHDALRRLTEQVFKVEHEADLIKDKIRQRIPKSFALPVFRGDLLAYLKLQDAIADSVEDIAVMLTIKRLILPESLADEVRAFVKQVLVTCEELYKASDHLKDLTENDFGRRRTERILELLANAERSEWEADKLQYCLAQNLFALDDEMKATDIFLWSGVFQELGNLANHADKTADRLRRMLSR